VQEVFLRAWLQLSQLRQPGSFPYWIGRMARHLGTTWFRNQRRRSEILQLVEAKGKEMEEVQDTALTPDQQALENERQQQLHEAIQTLPPQEREATLLHYVDGMPKNMVAKHMDIHPATVGRMLERATSRLKADLGEEAATGIGTLALPTQGPAATMACIASVAALTPVAREAIAVAAAKGLPTVVSAQTSTSAGTVSLGFLALLWQSLQSTVQGVLLMGTYKTAAAATVTATALAIGGYTVVNSSSSNSNPAPPSSAASQNTIVSSLGSQADTVQFTSPFNSEDAAWQFERIIEVQADGQMQTISGVEGQCRILYTHADESVTLAFQLNEVSGMATANAEVEDILGREFQILISDNGTISNLKATDGLPIDPFEYIHVLTGMTGTDLGPLASPDPYSIGQAVDGEFKVMLPISLDPVVSGSGSYTLTSIDRDGSNPKVTFDIETQMKIGGGLPVTKDERTRTTILLDNEESTAKGTWTFDLNNPVNSVQVVEGRMIVSSVRMVIDVPGRDQPVEQILPSEENRTFRATTTISGI